MGTDRDSRFIYGGDDGSAFDPCGNKCVKDGWNAYLQAVLDEYTIKALRLTVLATVSAVVVNTIFGIFASLLISKYYSVADRCLRH